MSLESIAYVSTASHPMRDEELQLILAQAREVNARLGVTGALLYADGMFMQVIEGPAEAIDEVFARVSASRRHTGIIELYREPVARREFEDWHMAFRRLDAVDFLGIEPGMAPGRVRELLRGFWSAAR